MWAQSNANAEAQAQKQASANTTSAVTADQLKGDILGSVQQILIENMRNLIQHSSVGRTPVSDLRHPGVRGTDADLMSYYGNPEALASGTVNYVRAITTVLRS